ncbi:RNA polymerase, sigma-24 subunit, ECF subfamily [Catenulispora acidiphila DSM 44928]|uniref:RNA polymerase, sigma-24 subunit, ECF subfamily n=1 Tax=Catenulispora acidiphila (strain DSM 44928 / JCM 14897 / NBRC 102108 / NRRL B-24433 / ID139908) TaxID=479433 RepID=C7QBT1_CATAD|nr:RNA polymerase, sigma-24 subunit, ECF subfamily [Catenulispora acidiphila DSM 44928]
MIDTNAPPVRSPRADAQWTDPAAPRDDDEFVRRADPYRRELLVHCYRMLGSVHDAEDLVQETFLRAWRGYDRFEGRSSLRIWLYRIATSACLTALENRSRRVLPTGLGAPEKDAERPLLTVAGSEVQWLQPLPDALASDPAAIVAVRDSVRLAFIAALQHLSAKQRAVLILRDVMDWHAAEVADLLDTTTIAVNSALRRARAQLEKAAPSHDELTEPDDPRRRDLLHQYTTAFENADVPGLLRLLRDDVVLEMPPNLAWFDGRTAVGTFLGANVLGRRAFTMVTTAANGQAAAAGYLAGRDGRRHAHAIQVLTATSSGISHIVSFNDPGLFAAFGLPAVLDGAQHGVASAGPWRG